MSAGKRHSSDYFRRLIPAEVSCKASNLSHFSLQKTLSMELRLLHFPDTLTQTSNYQELFMKLVNALK
jgi:hypothetical protein